MATSLKEMSIFYEDVCEAQGQKGQREHCGIGFKEGSRHTPMTRTISASHTS